jgi:hypothetical protein
MTLSTDTYDRELNHADLALKSALNEEDVKQAILRLGYDEERLQEGVAIYQKAYNALESLKEKHKAQIIAANRLKEKARECRKHYMKVVRLARRVIDEGSREYVKLGLEGRRKRRLGDWLVQTREFYTEALKSSSIQEKLALFAIGSEELEAGLQLVEAAVQLEQEHERRKSEAQQATLDRNAAFRRLQKWISTLKEAAAIALEATPQLLEKMGYLVES